MKKKYLITAAVAVLALGSIAVATQYDLLQGRFGFGTGTPIYLLESGEYASPVTTPVSTVVTSEVTSEVTSKVTSKGGTSEVTSEVTSDVPSVVTTPVASFVAYKDGSLDESKKRKAKKPNSKTLEQAALQDYKLNRSKYILSDKQVQQLINMYEKTLKQNKQK